MFLLDGKRIAEGTPFRRDDRTYTEAWWRTSSTAEKQAAGLVELPDPPRPDERYYYVTDDPADPTRLLVTPKPLEEVKLARKAELAAWRYAAETAGVKAGGVQIATDRDSQALIDSLQRALADGLIPSVRFKTASGRVVTMTTADATAVRQLVVQHVQRCRAVEADHAAKIDALTRVEEVIAYDIGTDWPA